MIQNKLFGSTDYQGTSDDYYTPKWIFDALNVTFDLDVCAPPGGGPFVPVQRYFTVLDDGLTQNWKGLVWMNPPFSNPLPWVHRFIEHGNGIALVPTSNGKWLDLLWNAPTWWTSLKSLRFHTPTGPAKGTMPTRCWLVASGKKAEQALKNSNIGAVR